MFRIGILFYFPDKESKGLRIPFSFLVDKIEESIMEDDEIYPPIIQMIKNLSEYFLCKDIELRNDIFPGTDGKEKASGFLIFP